MQWSDHCVLWQIFLWVFLFGLLPLLCVWFAVSFDETQVWLGDLRVVWLFRVMWGCYDLPAVSDLFGPCTNDFFTAYAHVRTEPQRDIGHTRGKKKNKWHSKKLHLGKLQQNRRSGTFSTTESLSTLGLLLRQSSSFSSATRSWWQTLSQRFIAMMRAQVIFPCQVQSVTEG